MASPHTTAANQALVGATVAADGAAVRAALSSVEHLITSCWPCNTGNADFTLDELGWTLKSIEEVRSDWTALTEE